MYRLNEHYKSDTAKLIKFLVPSYAKSTVIGNPHIKIASKYDYLVLENIIGDVADVQNYFTKIKKNLNPKGRLIITYYNHLWEPLLKLASSLGLRKVLHEQNWLDNADIANLLNIVGFNVITTQRRLLLPIYIPLISSFVNRWLAHLPFINSLCLTTFVIARPKQNATADYSVSIIVPARNEEGNIGKITRLIPKFGKRQEIIFIEGHSTDKTWEKIQQISKHKLQTNRNKQITIRAYRQKGKGKADAVRLGFKKAKGDILMILDADLTVHPSELKKFYEALAEGRGEFINGSRLVYPMEKLAMRTLNKAGNKIFSWLFTWILGQRFKDTLCGTKALFRKDYKWIVKNRKFFGDFDPFGDFNLIFGAIKAHLKVLEVPVRYRERKYGTSNISRFKHGLQLLIMTFIAFKKFKAW